MSANSDIPSPKEFVEQPRESGRENAVKSWLRRQSEDRKLEYISDVLRLSTYHGLPLVLSCQLCRRSLTTVLQMGLKIGVGLQWWLEHTIPGLGLQRVFDVIERFMDAGPEGVANAIFWLPTVVNSCRDRDIARFEQLKHSFLERYPELGSKIQSRWTLGSIS